MIISHLLVYKSNKIFFTGLFSILIFHFCKLRQAYVLFLNLLAGRFYSPDIYAFPVFIPDFQKHFAGFLLFFVLYHTVAFSNVFLVPQFVGGHLSGT